MHNCGGFSEDGNWYKGNLHSHTVNSDGMLKPEEAVKLYKDNGYNFLCLSEHDIYTDYRKEFNTEDFIIIPGIEYSAILYDKENKNRLKIHHVHGILGTEKMQNESKGKLLKHMEHIPPLKFTKEWEGSKVSQQMVDMLKEHGCVTTYNHPIWSRVTENEFTDINNVSALEIFNYNTVQESNTGYDVTYWDLMLRKGKKINGFASDDNHNEGLFNDSCGGWICVKAPSLTHDNIVKAFISGNYYSSAGPKIYDFGIKDDVVYIKSSNVNKINFICGNVINDGVSILGEKFEDTLTYGEYKLKGHETYVRVECIDKYGRTAWTNPIYLNWENK